MSEPRNTPGGEQPRADAARNREKILDAAALVLARDPSASLTEIADAAGLSRATAYRHFADVGAVREALMGEAMDVGRDLLKDHLAAMLAPEGPAQPMVDMMHGLVRAALPLEYRWTRAISNEPVPDGGLIDGFAPLGAAILKRGQTTGELRSDFEPEPTARALTALALHAVRRLHTGQISANEAVAMMRPFIEGLRRTGSR